MQKELTERGSVVQHYKGDKYMVLDIGTHSETGDIMVSYQSLKDNQVWFRPIHMFYEDVEFKGELVPRFKVFQ
jgi:hypothetical protein